jgi:glycosyltransferase involved in cell wall biosynthesis
MRLSDRACRALEDDRAHPKVSVIIHFLNAGPFLSQAVRSVFWQTLESWELVLVDGGSSDNSAAIACQYAAEFPDRVRVLRHVGPRPLGIFSSRIWGATQADAPILAHLDADDEWHPQFLERHCSIYQTYFRDRPGLVYCPMVYWWEDPLLAAQAHVQPVPEGGMYEPPALVSRFIRDSYAMTPGNTSVVASRDIIRSAAALSGIADEGMVEDQFLWSFIALRYPIFVSPEPLARYRQWSGSVCARTTAAGLDQSKRQQHLALLERYIVESYDAPAKDELLRACREAISA